MNIPAAPVRSYGPGPADGRRRAASAGLRARLALTAPVLAAAGARLWRADGLGARYRAYLELMHGVLRASVPLMERAAARCAELGDADPVSAPLAGYLRAHAEEERGHDDWLLDDVAVLGACPAEVRADLPPPAVARLVGAQYYWIEHHHPVALLGYIAVLEDNAPAGRLADHVAAAAGVPQAALRTVREHADLDGGHTAGLFRLLDELPLSRRQERAVAVSALHTVDGVVELFARIERRAGGRGGAGNGPCASGPAPASASAPGPAPATAPARTPVGAPAHVPRTAPFSHHFGERLGGGAHRP